MSRKSHQGFTLIELAIVLVIVGLVIGSVFAGRYLIEASAIRSQITQITQFNTAANTFRTKYGYLPGDIPDPDASNFGFASRGKYQGEGDGNGRLQGNNYNAPATYNGLFQAVGENAMFWVDLSKANLINGSFTTASPYNDPPVAPVNSTSNPSISAYLPKAKIAEDSYIYTYSGGLSATWGLAQQYSDGDMQNYFGIGSNISFSNNCVPCMGAYTALTVQQAYMIDSKMDDGLPTTGSVLAMGIADVVPYWNPGQWYYGINYSTPFPTIRIDGSIGSTGALDSGTCFDNSPTTSGNLMSATGVAGATQHYSTEIVNGAQRACNLSFLFQ